MKSPKLVFIFSILCLILLIGSKNANDSRKLRNAYVAASILPDTFFDSDQALAEWREKIKGREKEAAETVFKNIQSYKGIPAGRLLSIMKVAFNESLGVDCTHCHNPKAWESDEKPSKQITREMRTMMQTINKELLAGIENLQSETPRVNCTTCHRGAVKPGFSISKPAKDAKNTPPQYQVERLVGANVLISNELPEVTIKVEEEFDYVGNFDFEIIASSDEYDKNLLGKAVAAGERFVFVKADANQVVDKLFIVQFEGFLPHLDYTYNYNFDKAEQIGNNKYRHNTWFYNSKKLAEQSPQGEGAKTRAFLEEKGFVLEDEWMMSRFVGLASENRKNEIIIYHLEMLKKTTGYSLEEYENLAKKKAEKIRNALVKRSRMSFSIEKE